MQSTQHFKKVPNPENTNTFPKDFIWVPCNPNDASPYKKEMCLMDIPTEEQSKVSVQPLELNDFLSVLINSRPSVGKDDLNRYIEWTNEFGQEG